MKSLYVAGMLLSGVGVAMAQDKPPTQQDMQQRAVTAAKGLTCSDYTGLVDKMRSDETQEERLLPSFTNLMRLLYHSLADVEADPQTLGNFTHDIYGLCSHRPGVMMYDAARTTWELQ